MHAVATYHGTRVRGGGYWNDVVVTDHEWFGGQQAGGNAWQPCSFSELEFLETFDGDEELIDRHFITVQI